MENKSVRSSLYVDEKARKHNKVPKDIPKFSLRASGENI